MLEKRWVRTLVWVLTVISLSAAALRLANVQPRAATIVFIVFGATSYALNTMNTIVAARGCTFGQRVERPRTD